MKNILAVLFPALLCTCLSTAGAQAPDTARVVTTFSGSLGVTNNGISIIPTFALNKPAAVLLFSWKRKKLSFDPDIRIASSLDKGGMLYWVRYQLVEKKRFSLRIGTHPAITFVRRTIVENGDSLGITEALRFMAGEVAPVFQITPNWSAGIYYLTGHGFQSDGPLNTHFITLNTSISNLKLGRGYKFQLIPAVYYLNVDGNDGAYFTATGILTREKWPFLLQGTVNQTFQSSLPGNKDFLWNVTLSYAFSKKMVRG